MRRNVRKCQVEKFPIIGGYSLHRKSAKYAPKVRRRRQHGSPERSRKSIITLISNMNTRPLKRFFDCVMEKYVASAVESFR